MKKSTGKILLKPAVLLPLSLQAVAIITVGAFLVYYTITDYKPVETEALPMEKTNVTATIPIGKLELYTWNIGHCGLGSKISITDQKKEEPKLSREYYERCRDGILYQLTTLNKLDFVLLQEVDENADRSFLDNQVERFKATFRDYTAGFAYNFKVPAVPVPGFSTEGIIKSGLLTLSRFQAIETKRYSFTAAYGWPQRLFKPDRGFILSRYSVSNGKQLVLINTQNTDCNINPAANNEELNQLREVIVKEYNKGNYVIAGGDWSRNPSPFVPDSIVDGNKVNVIAPEIAKGVFPGGFIWASDARYPTQRVITTAYVKGETLTTITDFFVLSPNVKLLTVNTLQTGFEFSHHQPVGMIVELAE